MNAIRFTFLTLIVLCSMTYAFAQEQPVRGAIQSRILDADASDRASVFGIPLQSLNVLPEFYQRRSFEPAWNRPSQIDDLFALLSMSSIEGLNPEDYHLSNLERIREQLHSRSTPADQGGL